MPSKRSSSIIGIWAIFAVLVIVDFALFGSLLLDNIFTGLGGLLNVAIIAFLPIIAASLLLDRRATTPVPETTRRQTPQGARSASGEPLQSTRPKPRIKRSKRAEQLETIVVEPGAAGNSSAPNSVTPHVASSNSATNSSQTTTAASQFLRSRRPDTHEDEVTEKVVKEQLDALELEMAKLEEQLEQNGIPSTQPNEKNANNSEPVQAPVNSEVVQPNSQTNISSEEISSELQAVDELLSRLEQRKRAGGVDEETYQRLREKYLKRRAELG